jgi:hypothetical protein
LGTEAHRHVEFTGVELTGGAKLAALVEKATTGPVEKAAAGPCAGEDRGGREAHWRGRKTGCHALVRRRCHSAEWRRDKERGAVESAVAEAPRWSAAAESCRGTAVRCVFFFLFRTVGGEWMRR